VNPFLKFGLAVLGLTLFAQFADYIGLIDALFSTSDRIDSWIEEQRD
jgi:hypothetical protein